MTTPWIVACREKTLKSVPTLTEDIGLKFEVSTTDFLYLGVKRTYLKNIKKFYDECWGSQLKCTSKLRNTSKFEKRNLSKICHYGFQRMIFDVFSETFHGSPPLVKISSQLVQPIKIYRHFKVWSVKFGSVFCQNLKLP